MDLITQVLSSTTLQVDLMTLDFIMWFMNHLTGRFETWHLSLESEALLIRALIRILHIPEQDITSHGIIRHTMKTLINLTKCESKVFGRADSRSHFALEQIVQYEYEAQN